MHAHHQRIFLTRGEIPGQSQPPLHAHLPAHPIHIARLAPRAFDPVISLRNLLPFTDSSSPNFPRRARRLPHHRNLRPVAGERSRRLPCIAGRADHFLASPKRLDRTTSHAHGGKAGISIHILRKHNALISRPRHRRRRSLNPRSNVPRRATRKRHNINISTGNPLIAHQPFEERHILSIRRNMRIGNLQLRRIDLPHLPARRIYAIHPRHPPVRVSIPMRRNRHPTPPIRRPIVFVDIHVRRSNLLHRIALQLNRCQPLLINLFVRHASQRSHRLQRPSHPRHALNKKHRNPGPIRRKPRRLRKSLQLRPLQGSSIVQIKCPELRRRHIAGKVREKSQLPAVRRPCEFAQRKLPFHSNRMRPPIAQVP